MVVFAPALDLDSLEKQVWLFRRDYCMSRDPMSRSAINAFNRSTCSQWILLSTSAICFRSLQLEEGDGILTIDLNFDPNDATDKRIPGHDGFMKVDNFCNPDIKLVVWQCVGESQCRSGDWKKFRKENATEVKEYFIKLYSNVRGLSNHLVAPLYPSIPDLRAHWFPSDRILGLLQKQFNRYHLMMRNPDTMEEDDGRLGLSVAEAEELAETVNAMFKPSIRFFELFVEACTKFGRTALQSIAAHTNEPYENVVQYSKLFWKKIKMLPDADSIYRQVEEGEAMVQTRNEQKSNLARKIESCQNPEDNMVIVYSRTTGTTRHTTPEDRRLLCEVHRIGLEAEDLWVQVAASMSGYGFQRKDETWNTRFQVLMKDIEKEYGKDT